MSKKKKIIIGIVAVIVAAAAVVTAVIVIRTKSGSGDSKVSVYADKVSDVMYQNTLSVTKFTGMVEAADTLEIKKDAEKTVKEVLVSEGDTVEVGTPLFTYDVEDLTDKRDSAKLELESLNNDLEGYNAQIDQLTSEKKEASKEQQLDYTLQIQQVQTQQKQCQYNITSKQAEIKKYDDSINNATVNSTMAGLVKKINNDNSSVDDAGQSDAFMTIISTGDYRVKGKIDEQTYYNSGLAEGMSVIVRSRVDDEKTWLGTISKIDTDNPQTTSNNNGMVSSDSQNSESATNYYFYVQLADASDMLLGQHVFVEPDYGQSEKKEGIWLDESYIVNADDDPYVWVKNDKDKLEKRTVGLGDHDDALMMYEIKSGISEDDYIVWASDDLYEGEKAGTWDDYDPSSDEGLMTDETQYIDDGMTDEGGYTEDGTTDAGAAGEGGMTDEGSVTDGADQADTGNVQSDQSDAGTGEAEVQ